MEYAHELVTGSAGVFECGLDLYPLRLLEGVGEDA
jgi:hypothetical protein